LDERSPRFGWHTFLGSSALQLRGDVAATADDGVFVSGTTVDAWLGPDQEEPITIEPGTDSGLFVARLDRDGSYRWHFMLELNDVQVNALATSAAGGTYVGGTARVSGWPPDVPPIHPAAGFFDLLVMKLGADGSYLWRTYFGSWGYDAVTDVAVVGSDVAVAVGFSESGWTGPGETPALNGFTSYNHADIVVLAIGPFGFYRWHTFYGSPLADIAYGVAVDGEQNIYVTGWSHAPWLGPQGEPPLRAFREGIADPDGFVLALDPLGGYRWHAFFGTSEVDNALDIATDEEGNLYVVGLSAAPWSGPAGEPPLHQTSGGIYGGTDLFVLSLAGDGAYRWHTFLDTNDDAEASIAVGERVYVAGQSALPWSGPAGEPPLLPMHQGGGNNDAYVLELDRGGGYRWHAFLGSVEPDAAAGVAVSGGGALYLGGVSAASWDGPAGEPPLAAHNGSLDTMVTKIHP
jgi:hypothetical protein